MDRKDAERIVKDLNDYNILVYYESTPINAKISILKAIVEFDDWGFYIRDKLNKDVELRIRYVKLLDINMVRWSTKILTYKYETMEIKIEF